MSTNEEIKPVITVTLGLEETFTEVVKLHARYVRAEVDAGACGTRQDFDRLNRAREAYTTARDALTSRLALLDEFDAEVAAKAARKTARGL